MALYKYVQYLSTSTHEAFDKDHSPGAEAPYSGIYRCMGCGREIVAEVKRPLPPQNHHQHTSSQSLIRWRLIVFADGKAK